MQSGRGVLKPLLREAEPGFGQSLGAGAVSLWSLRCGVRPRRAGRRTQDKAGVPGSSLMLRALYRTAPSVRRDRRFWLSWVGRSACVSTREGIGKLEGSRSRCRLTCGLESMLRAAERGLVSTAKATLHQNCVIGDVRARARANLRLNPFGASSLEAAGRARSSTNVRDS